MERYAGISPIDIAIDNLLSTPEGVRVANEMVAAYDNSLVGHFTGSDGQIRVGSEKMSRVAFLEWLTTGASTADLIGLAIGIPSVLGILATTITQVSKMGGVVPALKTFWRWITMRPPKDVADLVKMNERGKCDRVPDPLSHAPTPISWQAYRRYWDKLRSQYEERGLEAPPTPDFWPKDGLKSLKFEWMAKSKADKIAKWMDEEGGLRPTEMWLAYNHARNLFQSSESARELWQCWAAQQLDKRNIAGSDANDGMLWIPESPSELEFEEVIKHARQWGARISKMMESLRGKVEKKTKDAKRSWNKLPDQARAQKLRELGLPERQAKTTFDNLPEKTREALVFGD